MAYLQARIEFTRGNWLKARKMFEQARPEFLTAPPLLKQADYWMGKCYEKLGETDEQLAAYQRAAAIDPTYLRARLGVAETLAEIENYPEALQEYQDILRLPNAPHVMWLELARLTIISNLVMLRSTTEREKPDNWKTAEACIKAAETFFPESPLIPILRAEVFFAQNRSLEAERVLKDAQVKMPKDLSLRLAQAKLAQRQKKWDAAGRIFDKAEHDLGDSALLRLARGQNLLRKYQGNDDPKLQEELRTELRKLAKNTDNLPGQDRLRLQEGLATLSLQAKDPEQAKRLYDTIAEIEPNDLQVRLMQFNLAFDATAEHPNQSGQVALDVDHMKEALQQIESIEGRGPLWHYCSALACRERAKVAEERAKAAKERAKTAKERAKADKEQAEADKHRAEVAADEEAKNEAQNKSRAELEQSRAELEQSGTETEQSLVRSWTSLVRSWTGRLRT